MAMAVSIIAQSIVANRGAAGARATMRGAPRGTALPAAGTAAEASAAEGSAETQAIEDASANAAPARPALDPEFADFVPMGDLLPRR